MITELLKVSAQVATQPGPIVEDARQPRGGSLVQPMSPGQLRNALLYVHSAAWTDATALVTGAGELHIHGFP